MGLTFAARRPGRAQETRTVMSVNAAAPRNSACEDFLRFAEGFAERFRAEHSGEGDAV